MQDCALFVFSSQLNYCFQAEAKARERHWQTQVQGLEGTFDYQASQICTFLQDCGLVCTQFNDYVQAEAEAQEQHWQAQVQRSIGIPSLACKTVLLFVLSSTNARRLKQRQGSGIGKLRCRAYKARWRSWKVCYSGK